VVRFEVKTAPYGLVQARGVALLAFEREPVLDRQQLQGQALLDVFGPLDPANEFLKHQDAILPEAQLVDACVCAARQEVGARSLEHGLLQQDGVVCVF